MQTYLSNSINYLLSEVTNRFWVCLDKAMKEIGLHSGQVFVLISLWNLDGQNQTDLAKSLNLSAPGINKMVKSLQSNGFVRCLRSKRDGRVVNVFLTDKGKAIQRGVEEQWQKLETEFFESLTETEKLVFFQLLAKIKGNLL